MIGEFLVNEKNNLEIGLVKYPEHLAIPARLELATLCLEGQFRCFHRVILSSRNHGKPAAGMGLMPLASGIAESNKIQAFGHLSGEHLVKPRCGYLAIGAGLAPP